MENKNGLELTEIGLFEVGAPKETQKKRKMENHQKKLQYIQVATNVMMQL